MITGIIGVVIFIAIVLVIACVRTKPAAGVTEEQGPMPKRHGGFGQRVHGGKS